MSPQNEQLTVVIVTYNSERFIEPLFRSLREQTYRNFSVLVIDNHSTDYTRSVVDAQKNIPITLIKKRTNDGFSKSYNEGIRLADSEFVCIANPDLVFDPECLAHLMDAARRRPDIAVFGPKVTRYPNTNILDTAGMEMLRSRRVLNRGEGEVNHGQFDTEEEVFGIAGTIMLLRTSYIMQCTPDGHEVFDEDFFMYKEDADFAWRTHLLGVKSLYVPSALASHVRTARKFEGYSFMTTLRSRQTKSSFIRFLSTRNHWALLYKNIRWSNLILDFPWIAWFEGRKAMYLLIVEPLTLIHAAISFAYILPKLRAKRAWLRAHQKVSNATFRKLLTKHP